MPIYLYLLARSHHNLCPLSRDVSTANFLSRLLSDQGTLFSGFFLSLVLITLLLSSCEPTDTPDLQLPNLRLQIGATALNNIKQKRGEALAKGYLESSGADYQDATINFGGKQYTAQVRLKGDWLDHLTGNKWSWRVKLGDDASIMQADQFSLQHPKTRFFLHEWVFHRLLQQEDLLTPRYEFVELWVNDDYKGIYAFEAHFTEALLARQQRPASVILKFNEDGFWQTQDYRLRYGKNVTPSLPDFEAANIEPFQKNKVRNDSLLHHAFNAGRERLEYLRLSLDEKQALASIDLDYWARFFALVDLTEAYHALRWHNMRWYYHPQTSRLYPIGFDGYGSDGIYYWFRKPFLGAAKPNGNKVYFNEEYFLFALFNNLDFRLKYQDYLLTYTDPKFVPQLMASLESDLYPLREALQYEFPTYAFQQDSLIGRAEHLRQEVLAYDFVEAPSFTYTIYDPMFASCETSVPLPAIGLKAFRSPETNSIQLYNYYCDEITIEASGPKRNKPLHERREKLKLPPFDIHAIPPVVTEISIPATDEFLFYSVENVDYWFKEKINPWPLDAPHFIDPKVLRIDTNAFQVKGYSITPRSRNLKLTSLQVIPANYQIHMPPGARISLNNHASMIVFGNVNWSGTPSAPIWIGSEDHTGRGVHFLNTGVLQLSHVTITNNQTFRDHGLLLNGAMTCWADSMRLENLKFQNIQSEDALNVINSPKIELRQLEFRNCSGDGLDIDFSAGSLQNASFQQLGGDGLDLSGSVLTISQLDFMDITDKALSIGEKTVIDAKTISVNGAQIGIAVKDESTATIRHGDVENCEFGVTVFNKKNYFGSAELYLHDCRLSPEVRLPISLESSHTLVLDGIPQKVTHLSGELARLFYPPAH